MAHLRRKLLHQKPTFGTITTNVGVAMSLPLASKTIRRQQIHPLKSQQHKILQHFSCQPLWLVSLFLKEFPDAWQHYYRSHTLSIDSLIVCAASVSKVHLQHKFAFAAHYLCSVKIHFLAMVLSPNHSRAPKVPKRKLYTSKGLQVQWEKLVDCFLEKMDNAASQTKDTRNKRFHGYWSMSSSTSQQKPDCVSKQQTMNCLHHIRQQSSKLCCC